MRLMIMNKNPKFTPFVLFVKCSDCWYKLSARPGLLPLYTLMSQLFERASQTRLQQKPIIPH